MDDYRGKIEKLPQEKLNALADVYRKTIAQLEDQYKLAIQAAMITIADYTNGELTKKRTELKEIEQLIQKSDNIE